MIALFVLACWAVTALAVISTRLRRSPAPRHARPARPLTFRRTP